MIRRLGLILPLAAFVCLAPSVAHASCENWMQLDQAGGTGNFFTQPGKSYGGWFWILGHGNRFLANGENPPTAEAGTDSGILGGVPLDPAPTVSWLTDYLGDGSTRAVTGDWGSFGTDGCADVNGNHLADPTEVLAVLVIDSTGSEYAVASGGGNGGAAWELGRINNAGPSAFGGTGNGIVMSPVPRPKFGSVSPSSGGKVDVEVILPGPREIPTYDEVGGTRPMVQGFQIMQGTTLLDESVVSGGRRRITAAPGEPLILRTVFGAHGDVGFFIDGSAPIPPVGGAAPKPEKEPPAKTPPADEAGDAAGAADEASAAAAAAGGAAGTLGAASDPEAATRDTDGDGIVDADDNCPKLANAEQEDTDGDAHGDLCDTCPFADDPAQADADDDGLGDRCDACPRDPENIDPDSDRVCGKEDNCPDVANPKQENADGDASGDACDKSFDPFVASITPTKGAAARGEKVALKLSVQNRSTGTRGIEVRLALKDSAGKEFAAAADPACLNAVPSVAQLEAGKSWERSCKYVPPKEAAAGGATLTLKVKDKEKGDVTAESTSQLTLR